ncbi:MAG: peptidoglycan-binding domain-containing protein [Patescibacteria group bacterium]
MNTSPLVRKNLAFVGSVLAVFLIFTLSVGSFTAHAATISRQLDRGDTGTDVSVLQSYLSGNAAWYPAALVTGYFGQLTEGGVQKFQTAQGIVSSGSPSTTGYGRVGPTTLNTLNMMMNSGNTGNQSTLYTAPVLGPLMIQTSPTTVTFTWSTNEPTIGQVYWNLGSVYADEATGPRQTPYVSGTLALDAGGLQTTHVITVSNLQMNTVYGYFVRSIDASGDVSVMLENTFRTN